MNWEKIAYLTLASRTIDQIEETRLVPEKKVLYQFSARGHDVAQIILGTLLNGKRDAASAYYRSRPLLLALGLAMEDAFAAPLMKSGSFSDGRDIGVVCNLPKKEGCIVLPMAGDVGSQFTPTVGWAQALKYRHKVLNEKDCEGSIAVVLGGEASVATNGFWSSLTIATTLRLPLLYYIEDNGYGISVTSEFQTPGGNIAKNLSAFSNLKVWDGNGSDPEATHKIFTEALTHVRSWTGPALVRLKVPRLSGHSGQDTQTYKSEKIVAEERSRDPLPRLKEYFCSKVGSEKLWQEIERKVKDDVELALNGALARPEPDATKIYKFVRAAENEPALVGGLAPLKHKFPASSEKSEPEETRINMLTAIRRTIEHELKTNPRVLVFGEDVGPKGGVHAATLGLQEAFGSDRVFDTSLSEEGIVGRALGMAISGLMPVCEIQFRKYADPATEQLNNCGTIRWRTNNRFAAPIVVRMPGGYFKCGDPWHSVSSEVIFAHAIGWQVAFPSNAEDAVGLLRSAMRSDNPTIFFEHRATLDGVWGRRPYPGDRFVVPFGLAKIVQPGQRLTIVSWGAMLERAISASQAFDDACEIIDLRTISPWDKSCVLESVKRTRRCLIVHEDGITAGFGAEIAATVAKEAFLSLDAPVDRLAVDDIPIPHNVHLMESILPSVNEIANRVKTLLEF